MTLKFSYFGTRGIGEPIRMLLTDQEVAFIDHRFSWEQWADIKPTMIFGSCPCLTMGDKEIVQSGTIIRHLARIHGLNGTNEEETIFIDMFYEGVRDLHATYATMIYQNYENGRQPFIQDVLPEHLARLEKLFRTYENGENFVAGANISYVDYVLFEELDIQKILSPTALDRTPQLKKFHEQFGERKNLTEYLKKRAIMKTPVNGNGKQ